MQLPLCCKFYTMLRVVAGGGEDLPCGSFASPSLFFSPSPCEFPLPLCVRAIVVVRERVQGAGVLG